VALKIAAEIRAANPNLSRNRVATLTADRLSESGYEGKSTPAVKTITRWIAASTA
jgi:hypothetical protein